ncbi:MAG TPA: cytochrome c, partial [Acidobacteriaceae bacterium]|nr:cytochrome c [Acidobacteriaceae bacterium]
ERYNIYCTPCHSRVGNGAGMIVERGYRPAGNFHTARLISAPLGHFFNVITNGYGAMPDYAAQVAPADRWAIVAYIRALQLSQAAKPSDAPSGAQVESLSDIAQRQGLPASYGSDWALPPTAVYGTPNNQDNGIPGDTAAGAKGAAAAPNAPAIQNQKTPAAPANSAKQ